MTADEVRETRELLGTGPEPAHEDGDVWQDVRHDWWFCTNDREYGPYPSEENARDALLFTRQHL